MLGTCPPMGPNSFIFTYIFAKKHTRQRSMPPLNRSTPPPMGNPGSATDFMQVGIFDIFLALVPMRPIFVSIDATFSRNQYRGEYPYDVI